MRLWTLHPKYVDRQGIIALWREGLLAQAVLRGKTHGYKNHPQLNRFSMHPQPLQAIGYYLNEVCEEARIRGYTFDASKITFNAYPQQIQTTSGQMEFEFKHLLGKLRIRSNQDYAALATLSKIDPHPLFQIIPGEIEVWEKVVNRTYPEAS
jgi:hypothetical protein